MLKSMIFSLVLLCLMGLGTMPYVTLAQVQGGGGGGGGPVPGSQSLGGTRNVGLIGCNPLIGVDCTIQHLAGLFVGIFQFLLGLAVVLALAVIVWGGFQMVKGWFEEEPEAAYKEGKQTIRRGIWGFVLVLGAFLIVETLLFLFAGPGRGINYFFQQAFGP